MPFVADADQVATVNAATAEWRQGDIIDLSLVGWLGLPDRPLTPHTAAAVAGDDSNVVYVLAETEGLVVVSQTCDVVRDCAIRPHVELARIVRLEEPAAGEASRGSRPRFVPLPGGGPNAFADLDIIVTAEKSLLASANRTPGLPSEADQRRFGRGVGRVYSRFAFPDDLAIALRGLVGRIRGKHARDSAEGRALEALEEIRITASPSWAERSLDVFITFAPPTREAADNVMAQGEWDELVDSWLRRAEPFGVIGVIDGAMIPLDELTGREYVDSDPLDVDYLSWGEAAAS